MWRDNASAGSLPSRVKRNNHYETAFEAFLRERKLPYVAVDESKRALFSGAKLKSFDFVVYSRGGPNLLVDVKGRKARGDRPTFQTWAQRRDVDDLYQWERIFGDEFCALFAFVHEVDPLLTPPPGYFTFAASDGVERAYQIRGIALRQYRDLMTRRSEKWDTVSVPHAEFLAHAKPIEDWL